MNAKAVKATLTLAKAIQADVNEQWLPPAEVRPSLREAVVPSVYFNDPKASIFKQVAHQINRTYEDSCFDACAVMIRKLIESLIIETFIVKGLASEISDTNGEFFYLSQLIDKALLQTGWHLTRNAKKALKELKKSGDVSAHNRRYVATRHDIVENISDIRIVVQEFLALAGLK